MAREDCINEESMATLQRLGGEALVREMITIFLDFVPKKMDQVMQGQTTANLADVEKGAHAIKSSAANVGALRLQKAAEEVEQAARLNTSDPLPELLQVLQHEWIQASDALRTRRG